MIASPARSIFALSVFVAAVAAASAAWSGVVALVDVERSGWGSAAAEASAARHRVAVWTTAISCLAAHSACLLHYAWIGFRFDVLKRRGRGHDAYRRDARAMERECALCFALGVGALLVVAGTGILGGPEDRLRLAIQDAHLPAAVAAVCLNVWLVWRQGRRLASGRYLLEHVVWVSRRMSIGNARSGSGKA